MLCDLLLCTVCATDRSGVVWALLLGSRLVNSADSGLSARLLLAPTVAVSRQLYTLYCIWPYSVCWCHLSQLYLLYQCDGLFLLSSVYRCFCSFQFVRGAFLATIILMSPKLPLSLKPPSSIQNLTTVTLCRDVRPWPWP